MWVTLCFESIITSFLAAPGGDEELREALK